MKLLEVKNLVKRYNGKAVVNGLNIDVEPGEVVGLLGPNGSGKTTAFYMTVGLIQPDEGEVYFKGKNVTHLPIHKRAKLGFGYLAQEPSIFRSLTVEENILCILQTQKIKDPTAHLNSLLQELHLDHLRKKTASSLSGGERRRLEITRALVTQPQILLLDEPFANIDPLAVADVKHLIRILKNKQISVLITDHNAREIFSIVDRSYLVQEGKVLLSGSTDSLINNAQARSTYLGEDFRL
ncbi:MAG: LPS export ABC transporter ATP-binding protein [Chlamydiae bacterium CG10_big_fil_rev_8_21_14_0_10_42_34]|nr:MAG: LPS export ABC transporter ATP-binding protein [Chlamydiae bacterium CG10_big_fil_rev_8_21_14_0_10_42_34]